MRSYPHIILEGPDGSGKTTLAWKLCEKFGYSYHHEGPPPAGVTALDHYASLLLREDSTVFDRLHLGELVYGPLLRGGSGLNDLDVTLLNRLVRGLGALVIICLPPWETCLANNKTKHEMIASDDLRQLAWASWVRIYSRGVSANARLYDYATDARLEAWIDFNLRPATCPRGVIGSPEAKFLFIGEQKNLRNGTARDLPFFSSRNSSRFLHDAISEAGYPEVDIAFTNARTISGEFRNLGATLLAMPTVKTVVALGTVAHQTLGDIPHHHIEHPQYWKRFHAREGAVYVEKLREIRHASR